jgi:hypothetical protein
MKEVEQYGQGYPRLAAFLLLAKEFTVVKRFDYLHMRSILELQDELAELQDQLHKCDDTEPIRLNLSSRRHDSNLERRRIMKQIHSKLSTYGQLFSLFSICNSSLYQYLTTLLLSFCAPPSPRSLILLPIS